MEKMEKTDTENVERKRNPFRVYAVRKGILSKDSLKEGYSPSFSERARDYSPQERIVINLISNWDKMNKKHTPFTGLWTGPYLETSDNSAIFNWKLADRRDNYLAFLRDSRLSNLPDIVDDEVAQKLENFKDKLGGDFYAYNLRYDESQKVLAKITFAYESLVDRKMKESDYKFLSDTSYEDFRDKILGRKNGKKN